MRVGVSIGCLAMIAMAIATVAWGWRAERTRSPASRAQPFAERLAITVGRSAGMVFGALAAGVLVIGAGGRLLMRVLAVTSPDAQGLLTDADEVVGEVSAGGTVFLVGVLGALAGMTGLGLYVGLRRWLPSRSVVAGLCGAAIGAGVLARPSGLIDPENPDFRVLTPRPLAVVIVLAMVALFGLAFGPLVDRAAASWPRPSWSLRGVAGLLPFALLLVVPPVAIAVAVIVVLGSWLGPVPLRAGGPSLLGTRLVLGFAAVGAVVVFVSAGQVLVL